MLNNFYLFEAILEYYNVCEHVNSVVSFEVRQDKSQKKHSTLSCFRAIDRLTPTHSFVLPEGKTVGKIADEIFQGYNKKMGVIGVWWDQFKQLLRIQTERKQITDLYQKIIRANVRLYQETSPSMPAEQRASPASAVSSMDAENRTFSQMVEALSDRAKEDAYLLDFDLLFSHYQTNLESTKKILIRWYGNAFFEDLKAVFKTFNLSDDYYVLFLQPGIACRLKEFCRFLEQRPSFDSPKELRALFSDYLGSQTFYRAMFLSGRDLKDFNEPSRKCVQNNISRKNRPLDGVLRGIFSLGGDSYGKYTGKYNTMPCQFCETKGLLSLLSDGLDFSLGGSPFIPMSQYRDVAVNAAYWVSGKGQYDRKFVVLKMNIPIIETVSSIGPFFFEKAANGTMKLWDEKGLKREFSHHDLEHLIYGTIPSTCIEAVEDAYVPKREFQGKFVDRNDPSYVAPSRGFYPKVG